MPPPPCLPTSDGCVQGNFRDGTAWLTLSSLGLWASHRLPMDFLGTSLKSNQNQALGFLFPGPQPSISKEVHLGFWW